MSFDINKLKFWIKRWCNINCNVLNYKLDFDCNENITDIYLFTIVNKKKRAGIESCCASKIRRI